jgi:hypothetical protein
MPMNYNQYQEEVTQDVLNVLGVMSRCEPG